MNELLLLCSVIICYGSTLIMYRLFADEGLVCFTAIATIAANIEVLIVIEAFGMEMTLGNVLFASTFLVTDILSEVSGKQAAHRAVKVGIVTNIIFIVLSQWWLLYIPGSNDWAMPAMKEIFSNTPRMMIAGMVVYAVVQAFDVWAYHKWWSFTDKKWGDHKKFLWLRNNGSTLVSQLINSILFNVAAFYGTYGISTLIEIIISTYVIYIATSILDTPFVYLARRIRARAI